MTTQTWLILLQILVVGIVVPLGGLLVKIWWNDLHHIQGSIASLDTRMQAVEKSVARIEGFLEGKRDS